jgi:hypothetical protein
MLRLLFGFLWRCLVCDTFRIAVCLALQAVSGREARALAPHLGATHPFQDRLSLSVVAVDYWLLLKANRPIVVCGSRSSKCPLWAPCLASFPSRVWALRTSERLLGARSRLYLVPKTVLLE